MKTIKYIFAIIVATAIANGCIKENTSECTPGVYLTYHYTLNKQNTNQFEDHVDRLEVYAFDNNKNLYQKYIFTETKELTNDHQIYLPLPQGTWTIMTWAGDMSDYTIKDQTLSLNTTEKISETEELITHHISQLYHGEITKVTTYEDKYTYAKIPLKKNISTLNINLIGLSKLAPQWEVSDFEIKTQLNNSAVTFENTISPESKLIRYTSESKIILDTLQTTHKVMRLMVEDTSGVITIKSKHIVNGKITIPLLETILKNPAYNTQRDLDIEDTYTFNIELEKIDNDIKISITINNWTVTHIIPGIK